MRSSLSALFLALLCLGCSSSQGRSPDDFESRRSDTISVATAFLRALKEDEPSVLSRYGSSIGGGSCIYVARPGPADEVPAVWDAYYAGSQDTAFQAAVAFLRGDGAWTYEAELARPLASEKERFAYERNFLAESTSQMIIVETQCSSPSDPNQTRKVEVVVLKDKVHGVVLWPLGSKAAKGAR